MHTIAARDRYASTYAAYVIEEVERPVGAKAWEIVVAWIEERILDGRLVRGSTLPAEREFAAQLGVSRAAVREAVRTLQANGVLRSSVGAGAAGGTMVMGQPHVALTRMLRMHVALANFPARDVTQVRVVLERLSSSLASVHADHEARGRMRDALEAMDDDALSRAEFNRYDTDFHVAIARGAGNTLAADLTVAIRESMRQPIMWGFDEADGEQWAALRGQLRSQHHAIMAAIDAKSADEAADLVEQHIWSAYEAMPRLHL
ncbi:FadR family transcriptional regulator [Yimella sp. cx-51]|nr:FCD domain-containing protein [Yimella sp. cx-51]MBC9957176.1 FadR family transcriptional regulator [Yimella sp. cx-51]QTH37174.1 FadR family transcriptional regulator [Yimella sp. cx-51]